MQKFSQISSDLPLSHFGSDTTSKSATVTPTRPRPLACALSTSSPADTAVQQPEQDREAGDRRERERHVCGDQRSEHDLTAAIAAGSITRPATIVPTTLAASQAAGSARSAARPKRGPRSPASSARATTGRRSSGVRSSRLRRRLPDG